MVLERLGIWGSGADDVWVSRDGKPWADGDHVVWTPSVLWKARCAMSHVATSTREHPLLRPVPALLLLVALSFLYNWPYLTAGFFGDEFCFLNMLRLDPLPYARWAGFWATYDVPGITSVWWFDHDTQGTFWRPLPSLIFEGSVRLFGERALPLHLFSIIAHGLVGGSLYLLLRRLMGRPLVAMLTAVLYLSCEDHSMSVGWISTFTDLICVLFINLSLVAHVRWLETRRPLALLLSLVLLLPAFLSKESAALAPLAIVLLTFFLPEGRLEDVAFDRDALRCRARLFLRDGLSWIPATMMMALYLALYRSLGFGGMNNSMYIDPFSAPGRYLSHLVPHLPVMWLAAFSPLPPSLSWFVPESLPFLAMGGVLVLTLVVAALWRDRRSGLVLWAFTFFQLALLPQLSSDASERGLYLPAISSSILLALLVTKIGPLARRLEPSSPLPTRFTRFVAWSALLVIVLPGVVLTAAMPFSLARDFETMRERVSTLSPLVEREDPERVVVLNTPGPFYFFYPPEIIRFQTRREVDVRVLSAVRAAVSVERIDDRTFILSVDDVGWLTNVFTGMIRRPETPRQGRVYEEEPFTATLLEMTEDGSDVASVRFHMDRPLSDTGTLFVRWNGDAFEPFDLAALPLRERVTLAERSRGFPM